MTFNNLLLPKILAVGLLGVLVGCSTTELRYEVTPPATEQGRACVVQCAAIRETCMGHESRKAVQEREMCEKTNDIQYSACITKTAKADQGKDCIRKRPYCYAFEDAWRCKKDYDACFVNCGGAIKEIREEKK